MRFQLLRKQSQTNAGERRKGEPDGVFANDTLCRELADSALREPRAHLKTHHRFERVRLQGRSGARDEFHLAAIVQNLKTLANHIWRPPPDAMYAATA
jgi:hypothetical protein